MEINNNQEIAIKRIYECMHSRSEFLDLSGLELLTLPAEITNVSDSITDLRLSDNNLTDVSLLKKFKKIRFLDVVNNNLDDAEFISNHKELEVLYISFNPLKSLSGILMPPKLVTLHAANCGLNILGSIHKCIQLQELNISFNQIQDIKQLKKLSLLKLLSLESNQVKYIQPLVELNNLETVLLKGCPIEDCPADIWQTHDIKQIRAYFKSKISLINLEVEPPPIEQIVKTPIRRRLRPFQNIKETESSNGSFSKIIQEKRHDRNRDVKLILLGNSDTGKSSLLHYLKSNEFLAERSTTHGMQVVRWKPDELRFPELKDITVSVWDFGGQEYYHEAYRLFLSANAVYVVMWCNDNDVNGVRPTKLFENDTEPTPLTNFEKTYWLDTVKFYSDKSTHDPLILVQCKTDKPGNEKKRVSQELHDRYKITDSFHISLKEGCNPDNKRDKIHLELFAHELAKQLALAADKVGVNSEWEKIRREVLNLHLYKRSNYITQKMLQQKSWIDLEKFYVICKEIIKRDLTEDEKYTIPRWLSKGGVAIYFANHSVLGDRIFLNPQEMTQQIYSKLERKLLDTKGELIIEKGEVFKAILKDLELVFEHPDDKDGSRFIAPQYLPENHAIEDLFKIASNKAWQQSVWVKIPMFYYKKILNGLIFCLASASNSQIKYFWKHGVLFLRDDLRVLVKGLLFDAENQLPIVLVSVENGKEKNNIEREIFNKIIELMNINSSAISKINSNAEEVPEIQKSVEVQISRDGINYVNYAVLLNTLKAGTEAFVIATNDKTVPIKPFASIFPNESILNPKKIFLSYSHQNTHWLNRLRVHLSGLKHSNLIEAWTDQEILPGEKWDDTIKQQIEKSDLFILLLSADFVASNYIWKIELPAIKTRLAQNGGEMVMILTEPFDIGAITDISSYELLPKNSEEHLLAISLWSNHEEALSKVAAQIRNLVTK